MKNKPEPPPQLKPAKIPSLPADWSNNDWHHLIQAMSSGLAVHEIICDETGRPIDYRFLYVNPAFEHLTGLTSDQVIGKTARQVLPTLEDFWISTYGKVALTGEATKFQNYSHELDRHFDIHAYSPQKGQFAVLFTDITTHQKNEKQLEEALGSAAKRTQEINALLEGARAILTHQTFENAARAIFDHARKLLGAVSGYVALLNPDGTENEVLFLEAGGLPCTVNPELPMPIRGLRERAYATGQAVYDNDFSHSHWQQFLPKGHVRLHNVLFAPMVLDQKAVGLLGLANKPADFTENDARLATAFGELAAVALQNSKNLDARNQVQSEREKLIVELRQALAEVKKLSGFLPICANCKKIRDDAGYWQQIEQYIQQHSDAQFTHGICPACAIKLYPYLFNKDDTDKNAP